ncbi:MAG: MopE-related protein, partial [Myxococcota bacterium]
MWWALGGCTFVTNAEVVEQRRNIDEDADGVSVGEGDCDDRDPDVNPGMVEIPYDGIDNDCGGDGDMIDVDGDGRVATEAGGDDCDDTDAKIAPGLDDEPYDGIDTDCARDNDYDADGDGFMGPEATPALVSDYALRTGANITEEFGDCDDTDPDVFPDAPGEVPYDGVDTDCDAADDFDVDSDGVRFPEDCLDQPDTLIALDPADVFPGAPDAPYDGIDADCQADNDFDVDGDGFIRPGDLGAYNQFEALYGLDFGAVPGDCDDSLAEVRPGALERLG